MGAPGGRGRTVMSGPHCEIRDREGVSPIRGMRRGRARGRRRWVGTGCGPGEKATTPDVVAKGRPSAPELARTERLPGRPGGDQDGRRSPRPNPSSRARGRTGTPRWTPSAREAGSRQVSEPVRKRAAPRWLAAWESRVVRKVASTGRRGRALERSAAASAARPGARPLAIEDQEAPPNAAFLVARRRDVDAASRSGGRRDAGRRGRGEARPVHVDAKPCGAVSGGRDLVGRGGAKLRRLRQRQRHGPVVGCAPRDARNGQGRGGDIGPFSGSPSASRSRVAFPASDRPHDVSGLWQNERTGRGERRERERVGGRCPWRRGTREMRSNISEAASTRA